MSAYTKSVRVGRLPGDDRVETLKSEQHPTQKETTGSASDKAIAEDDVDGVGRNHDPG